METKIEFVTDNVLQDRIDLIKELLNEKFFIVSNLTEDLQNGLTKYSYVISRYDKKDLYELKSWISEVYIPEFHYCIQIDGSPNNFISDIFKHCCSKFFYCDVKSIQSYVRIVNEENYLVLKPIEPIIYCTSSQLSVFDSLYSKLFTGEYIFCSSDEIVVSESLIDIDGIKVINRTDEMNIAICDDIEQETQRNRTFGIFSLKEYKEEITSSVFIELAEVFQIQAYDKDNLLFLDPKIFDINCKSWMIRSVENIINDRLPTMRFNVVNNDEEIDSFWKAKLLGIGYLILSEIDHLSPYWNFVKVYSDSSIEFPVLSIDDVILLKQRINESDIFNWYSILTNEKNGKSREGDDVYLVELEGNHYLVSPNPIPKRKKKNGKVGFDFKEEKKIKHPTVIEEKCKDEFRLKVKVEYEDGNENEIVVGVFESEKELEENLKRWKEDDYMNTWSKYYFGKYGILSEVMLLQN